MWHPLKVLALGLVLALCAQFWWRRWQQAQQRAQRQWARQTFPDLREQLQTEFLAAATATGKPRGLRWKQCTLDPAELFAVDRVSGALYALVGATIGFEAIRGGGMEEVAAVDNLRSGTAVFTHRHGRWTTDGRALFNLDPQQALTHYQESLQPLES